MFLYVKEEKFGERRLIKQSPGHPSPQKPRCGKQAASRISAAKQFLNLGGIYFGNKKRVRKKNAATQTFSY